VLYTIYMGGYRKALKDALLGGKSPRYVENLNRVQAKLVSSKHAILE
jgi:hypothetical protein